MTLRDLQCLHRLYGAVNDGQCRTVELNQFKRAVNYGSKTSAKIAIDPLANRSYPILYLYGHKQDLALEDRQTMYKIGDTFCLWDTHTEINYEEVDRFGNL
jgi:hypothetical protein